jgi:hypothetical protein
VKETIGAEILVEVRPMDAVCPARNLPVVALLCCGMKKLPIPGVRYSDSGSVA